MKKMTKEEFDSRTRALLMAKKIFIPHLTKSLDLAFEIYLGVLSEEQHKLRITTKDFRGPLDFVVRPKGERPECPECGVGLMLRKVSIPKDPKLNRFGWQSAWECLGCGWERYSTETRSEVIKRLKKGDKL